MCRDAGPTLTQHEPAVAHTPHEVVRGRCRCPVVGPERIGAGWVPRRPARASCSPYPARFLPRPGLRRYGAARTGLAERGRTGVRGRGRGRPGPPRALSTLTCDITARTRPHVKSRAVSPGVEQRPQLRCLGGLSLQRAPPGPLDASAGQPPAASARRLGLADIRVTRHRVATSRSLAPFSHHSPAASRTRS